MRGKVHMSLNAPSKSSIMASAHPARFAWILGNILLMRLLWWIFESTVEGEFLRWEAEMREIPDVLSYVVAPSVGFHSGKIISVLCLKNI